MQVEPVRAGAPTGIVAFLFSDVEASTRRWERYGDAMRDALRRHDEILWSEIEARRGYVFKTIGDAFCAAFWTAGDALDAAVGVQRRLGREDFGTVDGLSVRIAIHAGETDERYADYFGVPVNRTARLLSAGQGGQILLSGFAAGLALPALPAGVTLRHLGELPLRDLKEPEPVYQPVGPELRSEFKPLRALETPPNNLPRQSTSFVGRHDDIAQVESLLDAGGLLTIVGAGGIGKTRLALEVAASRLNDRRDGAWFVDLSSVVDPALVAGTMLSALGGERSTEGEALDDLLKYLEKRELLLVLDNSEHLISDVAVIAAAIVARCPHVTVLATSREPLDISSERIYRLSTLDLAAAVQLFGERARAVDHSFRVEARTAVVEDICSRLDGIALAIELAAARIRTMSVENVAAHLELRLLAGGRDRRPRQQTMRALIDWSYDLLNGDERRVLRSCAVFLRGFTLRAASDVCGSDEWVVLDELGSLVDKSLVVADVEGPHQRYRLLEPIREYAYDKLSEVGELPEMLRRHAHTIASLARAGYEEWELGPGADWLSRLASDLSNVRVALRWCTADANDPVLGAQIVAATTPLFLRLSLLAEGIEYCEGILGKGLVLAPLLEARLRYGLSMLFSNIGANKNVLEQAALAVPLYRAGGDSRGLARALSQVARRCASQSRYDEAKTAAKEALQLARDSADRRLLADVLRRCAEAFSEDGVDAVRGYYQQSVALFRSFGRDDDTARSLMWWGEWEAEAGNFSDAVERLLEAKQLDGRDAAVIFFASDIASYYLALGDWRRAEPHAHEALVLAAKARHPIFTPMAISYLAMIATARDVRAAARLAGYAEERFRVADWQRIPYEQSMADRLLDALKCNLPEAELARLLEEGAAWHEEQAVTNALSS
jgi:predicted ATPase/class 3 adenylate cyclase